MTYRLRYWLRIRVPFESQAEALADARRGLAALEAEVSLNRLGQKTR